MRLIIVLWGLPADSSCHLPAYYHHSAENLFIILDGKKYENQIPTHKETAFKKYPLMLYERDSNSRQALSVLQKDCTVVFGDLR